VWVSPDPSNQMMGLFLTERDLLWVVDFVIGENAVLEDEPPGTPAPTVVYPLVKNAGDSTPYNVVDLFLTERDNRTHWSFSVSFICWLCLILIFCNR
jgi:hypothetical protein